MQGTASTKSQETSKAIAAVRAVFAGVSDAALALDVRREILARSDGRCFYCSRPVEMGSIVFDHFVPRIRGGTHDRLNRVASCLPCDGSKGARLPTEKERTRLAEQVARSEGATCPTTTGSVTFIPVLDPLGHDVSDFRAAAQRMADDALAGRNADAVQAELDAVLTRFPDLRRQDSRCR